MRILFVTGDAHFPQMSGGVQSSTDQLIRHFRRLGHDAALLCALHGGTGWLQLRSRLKLKLQTGGLTCDRNLGYPVYRAWAPWDCVAEAIQALRPDVVLIQHNRTFQFLKAFHDQGVPSVVYLRNVEFDEIDGDIGQFGSASFIANSRFTAKAYHDRYGLDCHVIPPSIEQSLYRVTPGGDKIVFINPYPVKGVERALEIAARCPDLPFWFLESWALSTAYRAEITDAIRRLPNVDLINRTQDMRAIYGAARLVLAPSKWEEAWGRVASEAHVSGIPVIGSNRGGLPEAIGPGGVTLDYDAPIDEWVEAVRSVYGNPALHALLSTKAKLYAQRDELNSDKQVNRILSILESSFATQRATP